MKKIMMISGKLLIPACFILFIVGGCNLVGLDLQKDYNRDPDTINAHLNKNAWEYIKDRSIRNSPDTLFKLMYDAIIYSGMDTTEYTKPGRTFILLQNNAIYQTGKNAKNAYFNVFPDSTGHLGDTNWLKYRKEDVKNYLQYLILPDEYTHWNIPITRLDVNTLCPQNVYPENPNSVMNLRVYNGELTSQQDEPIVINENESNSFVVTTSDLRPANGIIHVVSAYVNPHTAVVQ